MDLVDRLFHGSRHHHFLRCHWVCTGLICSQGGIIVIMKFIFFETKFIALSPDWFADLLLLRSSYQFRPIKDNPYFKVEDSDEEEAKARVQMEEMDAAD
jgi:hypothetical protein